MLVPPLLPNDAHRPQVASDPHLIDRSVQERLDRITRIAACLFGVPIVFVSLVGGEREWFKSRLGLALESIPHADPSCAHAPMHDGVVVIEDAHQDARSGALPIIAETGARFYAGHPLPLPDGHVAGMLCLIDTRARTFDDEQRARLADLAALAANEIAAIELLRAHERRLANESWIRVLLDHIPDGVLMLDSEGAVMSANPAAERMFGSDLGGLAGRPADALFGEDAALWLAPGRSAGEPAREGSGRRIDGSVFPVEVQVAPMCLDGQRRNAAIVRDVTRQHEDAQRSRLTEERRRKHFTTATHELRTPMASILGFSELLLKRDFDPATSRELVDIIHRQAGRLVDLINQLLDLARIEAGGTEGLSFTRVDVAELVEQTLTGLNGLGQNHRIRVELEPGLPPFMADPQKMQQALTNIISNSIKYSAQDTTVDISAAALQRNAKLMIAIRVADHGIGMTPEQLGRIFDAFYRAGESPNVQGTGLGMTIFKEIIELHGGHADIESRPGAGTAVTVWLPALPDHG